MKMIKKNTNEISMSSLFGVIKKLKIVNVIKIINEEKTRLKIKSRFFFKLLYEVTIRSAIARKV
jgi:hypothetical protein